MDETLTKIESEDNNSLFDLDLQEPTSRIERLFQKIKAETKPEKRTKISNMTNFIKNLKKMNFMNFHKDKKIIFSKIDTHDIKHNKQLSEMFQPFYDYKTQKGSMKSFFFHNRYQFKDFPEHLTKFQIYDPEIKVNNLLSYRNKVLTGIKDNKQLSNLPNKLQKVKQAFRYNEEIDDLYSSINAFEKERLKKHPINQNFKKQELEIEHAPLKEEKPSSQFKIRRVIPLFKITKNQKSQHMIKLSTKSEIISNGSHKKEIKEKEKSLSSKTNLMIDLLKYQFSKNLTFNQQTVTEDFLEEIHNNVNYGSSHSLIPLIEMKERRYFELFQMKDPKSLILYSINDEGMIDDCQKLSNLEEFVLPKMLKHRPFYLFLFYHAFLLFENNWSFIYNLLLKNPIFENIKIDFSNIISGINLTKFLIGDQFYETTKRPLSNSLTKQLFKILQNSSKLSLYNKRIYPKKKTNIKELDFFDFNKGLYQDDKKADFDREKYIQEFCLIEDDIKTSLLKSNKKNLKNHFPTPYVKKEIVNNNPLQSTLEKNHFDKNQQNDHKFSLFCKTIERSERVDFMNYTKNSKKQLFCYKLRKFKGYRDKKLGKIKSLAKKFKNKNGNFYK